MVILDTFTRNSSISGIGSYDKEIEANDYNQELKFLQLFYV